LRRQATTSRFAPAGSSRDERLDPFALPLRFVATDHTADERIRLVELHRERVVLRRALRGIKMLVHLPVASYLGVAIRIELPTQANAGSVAIVLEHPDPALSLTLYRADHGSDIVAEWQSWGRALSLPLLVAEADGRLREPFARIGAIRIGTPIRRRRRHSMLSARRPTQPLRRRFALWPAVPIVHRGKREIIARD
jgi:uncharacterized protein DUF6101